MVNFMASYSSKKVYLNRNIENFRSFLIQNQAYENFCAAIMERDGLMFDSDYIRKNLYDVINHTITWDNTPEGSRYWEKLSYMWNRAYEQDVQFTFGYKSIW